jgi:hypothetical protein
MTAVLGTRRRGLRRNLPFGSPSALGCVEWRREHALELIALHMAAESIAQELAAAVARIEREID